ncbi:MAG: helix-turn-helix transcriptional regulator [Deltaproteobacteria bacterium]|nr:helix-turn-helix transcriptional regulator [Deltaproteobacteria bacterium]
MPERRRKRREVAERLATGASEPAPGLEVFDVGPPEDGWVLVSVDLPSASVPELPTALREVLAMIVRGETNRTIASLRGTSLRTVENQVATLLRRFRARSRVDLVRLALEPSKREGASRARRPPGRRRAT